MRNGELSILKRCILFVFSFILLTSCLKRDEMSLNKQIANLLSRYYAYPEDRKRETLDLISQIRNKGNLKIEEVENELAQFNNKHLYLVNSNEESPSLNHPCVQAVLNRLVIHSFWCVPKNKEQKGRSEIRENFKYHFITSLQRVMSYLDQNNLKELIIDLKGNGGGGDDEMMIALYPFLKGRVAIYDYQFKWASTPHYPIKAISKFLTQSGLSEFSFFHSLLNQSWDQRRTFYFDENDEMWNKFKITDDLQWKKLQERFGKKIKEIEIKLEVDSSTGSASELYASILVDLKRAEVLSFKRTKGSVGAPSFHTIRSREGKNYQLAIPSVRVWRIRGNALEGRGL
ncbi:MAG: hypothetical protein CME60_05220 [Halobacteriovoraceae bacterium]|nr:hypothetical protein [Halobacteriovoraceae bacterium]